MLATAPARYYAVTRASVRAMHVPGLWRLRTTLDRRTGALPFGEHVCDGGDELARRLQGLLPAPRDGGLLDLHSTDDGVLELCGDLLTCTAGHDRVRVLGQGDGTLAAAVGIPAQPVTGILDLLRHAADAAAEYDLLILRACSLHPRPVTPLEMRCAARAFARLTRELDYSGCRAVLLSGG